MDVVIFISGPACIGKTNIAIDLSDRLKKETEKKIMVISQDSYYLSSKPLVMVSNGKTIRSCDSLKSYDLEKFNNDLVDSRYQNDILIVVGCCLRKDIIKVVPDVHIHLSYVPSEMVDDILMNKEYLKLSIADRMKITGVDENTITLIINEVTIPFYFDVLKHSMIDYVLPVCTYTGYIQPSLITNRIVRLLKRITFNF